MSDLSTSDRARSAAHREAVRVGQMDLVEALISKLGAKVVAFMANRDTSTISRWKSGVTAEETALQPLRIAFQVVKLLESVEADATIRAWFLGSNPQLDDLSPAEALRERLNRETLAAARAFVAGA